MNNNLFYFCILIFILMMFEKFEKHDKTSNKTLQTILQTILESYECSYYDYDGTDGGDFDFL